MEDLLFGLIFIDVVLIKRVFVVLYVFYVCGNDFEGVGNL